MCATKEEEKTFVELQWASVKNLYCTVLDQIGADPI